MSFSVCKYIEIFKNRTKMSSSIEIQNQSELAKANIVKSDYMSDEMKKNLLGVISLASEATNGLSPEEKIQRMTESIFGLAIN